MVLALPRSADPVALPVTGGTDGTEEFCFSPGIGREALKKVRQRQGQMGTFPYSNYLYENVSIWSGIRYRRKIERHGWHLARFAPGAVDDPAAWLEGRLGPVEVETPPVAPRAPQVPEAAAPEALCEPTARLQR